MTTSQGDRLQACLAERARRRIESLNLYEPMPIQMAFHASQSRTRLLRGSNRGGKTLPAAVEVARAVCGVDPYRKYPKMDGRFFCVGKDLRHISLTMWRKLGRAGAFKIIRDLQTGQWRAYRPWDAVDQARHDEVRPAPPLIPPRMIREIGWENKKLSIPSIIYLHNGWEISFFSSLGKPPQGADIDGAWLDEEIVDPDWIPELQARMLDRNGRIHWSATPQAGTAHLFDLHERAEKEENLPNPKVTEHVVLLVDNLHIGDDEKREFAEGLSEEEFRVRVGGEYAMSGYLVYPEFNMIVHGVEYFQIPSDWTRYAVVDPGHQVCAVLFAAVPPPEQGEAVYLYDELYIRNCNAAIFARRMQEKVGVQNFEAFLIDYHFGMHTEAGSGRSVAQQFADALRAVKVRSAKTGYGFQWASDDIPAGIMAVRDGLRIRDDGTTRLRVLKNACPALEWELKRYKHLIIDGVVSDKPNQKKNNHQCDNLRYLMMGRPRYVKPGEVRAPLTGSIQAFRDKMKRQREKENGEDGRSFVHLGPGKRANPAH